MDRDLAGRQRGSRAVLTLVCASALGLLAWLGATGVQTRAELRLASQRAVHVAELRGTIKHLGEWLTMSTRMAVLSDPQRWRERYTEALPQLSAAITEAVALATPKVGAELARTTDEAYHDLRAMQQAAFRLVADGDREAARALLDGPEYGYLEAVYAAGLDAFGRDLATLAADRAMSLNDRAWLELSGLGFSAVLLVAVALGFRGHARLQAALANTDRVARTDALTGLANRRQFRESLTLSLRRPASATGTLALLLLDLDHFKAVNDTLGHAAGDSVLREVAARMGQVLGSTPVLARLGGDEFAVLVEEDACAHAAALAEQLIAAVQAPIALGEQQAEVGLSVGVALAPAHGSDEETFLKHADLALYHAKAEGRGVVRVYEPAMDAVANERLRLEGDLRRAIAAGDLTLHYQPQVRGTTGALVGFEALVRWQHPTHGLVPPAAFIPLAEATGLIVPLGEWVLRTACREAAGWTRPLKVAVNLSPRQFAQADLPGTVRAILAETGLSPMRLELEITETVIINDMTRALTILRALKDLGLRVAMDDFGTGYSSLATLQAFPFDAIKIDRAFVGALEASPQAAAIVRAVLGLGRSLGMVVVAEGVETPGQARFLADEACAEMQGYLFGRPQPIQAFTDALQGTQPTDAPELSRAGATLAGEPHGRAA